MDGHFVPNITMGIPVVSALKPICREAGALLDVHLMVANPEDVIPGFANAGADIIIIHVEACVDSKRTVDLIRKAGVRPGVTLNPATSLTSLEEILDSVDQVLLMSVSPGYGAQNYLPTSTNRIIRLRQMLIDRGLVDKVDIEVDGGIKLSNVAEITRAGATILVIGSGIFNAQGSIASNIQAFRNGISIPPGL
jgi:ribulose-phosphate 3-epimerase